MKASELMTKDRIWVTAETTDVRQAAQLMADHNIGVLPVVDAQGLLEGLVTDRDICCRIVAKGKTFETPVREIMTQPAYSVGPDAELDEIERLMSEHKIRRLPVQDSQRKLLGVISLGDLAKHCHGLLKQHHLAETLETVCTRGGGT